jgi:hypothetical protein
MSKPDIHVDVLPVNEDLAVELFIHHAALAASYFEATPDDNCAQIKEELGRILNGDQTSTTYRGIAALAEALDGAHGELKKEWGEE